MDQLSVFRNINIYDLFCFYGYLILYLICFITLRRFGSDNELNQILLILSHPRIW